MGFRAFASAAASKLDHALAIWNSTTANLAFYGGDERLGAYFEAPNCPEARRAYRMLVIWALRDFSASSRIAGIIPVSEKYFAAAEGLIKTVRKKENWFSAFGMHAAADAINSGFATPAEISSMIALQFENLPADELASFTPFNQFFIVRALFEANRTDLAVEHIRAVWGGMLRLGATSFWEVYSPQWLNNSVMESVQGHPPMARMDMLVCVIRGRAAWHSLCRAIYLAFGLLLPALISGK